MTKNCPECGKFLIKYVNDNDHRYEWYCADEECYHYDFPVEYDPDGYWEDYDDELRKMSPDDPRLPENHRIMSDERDLARARRGAEYVERLEERGISPFSLFLELNSLKRDGRES